MSRAQVAVRRAGALVALAAASVLLLLLLLLLVPGAVSSEDAVLAVYAVFQTACASVLLSPASRAVPDLTRLAARVMFDAPDAELWTALRVPLRPPAGPRATWQTEPTMRRTGALLALAAASVLVPLLGPGAAGSEDAVYAIFLVGSAAVLLSPANRAVAELARAAEKTWLRWAGFTCISYCAAAGVRAAEKVDGLLLYFLLLLVGVWAVTLSMIAARERGPQPLPLLQPVPPPPPPAEEGRDGGAMVNVRVTPTAAHAVN